ncbi:ABC transporter substrate-binding protein [Chloroflexi bacterium TSY]|nr:ABC transporter substrate-binding protein [Chloroflexi bacterium TSY]
MLRKFPFLTLLLVTSLLFAACAPASPATQSGGDDAAMADTRGHLNVVDDYSFGTATTLDPHDPNRFYQYTVMGFESLVTKDVDGNHVPSLAESWEPNEDASAWTIQLREGVLFHDGTEMKAADVAYSLMRLTDPEVNSPLLASYEIVQSVDIVNDYEVVVNLDPANVDFPELLTAYQSAIMRENGAETVAEDGIGTGPFKLSSLDIAGVTELVAHDGYWNGPPASATSSIIAVSDGEARVQAMLSGQIEFLDVSAEQVTLYNNNDDFTIQTFPTGAWQAMVMRTDTPPFDDPRVRKAIRVAADREEIIAQALDGNGIVACDSPVWTGDIYRADIDCPQDIELAKELLAEAGYPDGIDIDIYTSPLHSAWAPMLETYQAQAAEAGIRLNIIQAPSDGYWSDTWMTESFSTTAWGERSAAQILPEAYRSGVSWNETYYNNPDFDALLDAAAAEVDTEARIEIYHQLQDILWEDGGSLVPYHISRNRILKSCLEGLPSIGTFFIDYSTIDASGC